MLLAHRHKGDIFAAHGSEEPTPILPNVLPVIALKISEI